MRNIPGLAGTYQDAIAPATGCSPSRVQQNGAFWGTGSTADGETGQGLV